MMSSGLEENEEYSCLSPDFETKSKIFVDDDDALALLKNNNINNDNKVDKDDLYAQLWHACCGHRVYVPRAGDRVFYFPQGHMEQVKAYANEDDGVEMPIYNLPSKIICKVVHVQLKAEAQTDEVFAQITLLPEAKQEWQMPKDDHSTTLPLRTCARYFSKALTPSDTSTHGGLSVPKRQADECLPPLDMSQQPPVQELIAKDLHGLEWHFRHIYRGQPKRHLLTSGWSTFVNSKKLVAGDSCIFLRGEGGELHVGIRRTSLQHNASTSVISGHSMQHGILASAFHAISTGTMFTVYYRPWTTPSNFIVSFEQYMKSIGNEWSVGTKFQMRFEGEDCSEQRVSGTIVDIKDLDCVRWPNSEWRCLKVQWDTESDALVRPEKVSPWEFENIKPINKHKSIQPPAKRARKLDSSSPGVSILVRDDLFQGSLEHTPKGVLQGQENRVVDVHKSSAFKWPSPPRQTLPPIPDQGGIQLGLENQLKFPRHDPSYWYPGSQDISTFDQKGEIEDPETTNGNCKYMLFGVNLVNDSAELPSTQAAISVELQSSCSIPPITSQSSSETVNVSETSKSIAGFLPNKQCRNGCSVSNRSCTKVLKYGTALGRSVNLTRFDGYDELICGLDQMFDFNGKLIDRSCGWHVTYMDVEGDIMLIGDYPWQEFRSMVQRMFICPKEHTDNLNVISSKPTTQ